MNYQDLFLFKLKKKRKMSATNNECNRGSPSILDLKQTLGLASARVSKGVFALLKIGFLQSPFYEVMWSSLIYMQKRTVPHY